MDNAADPPSRLRWHFVSADPVSVGPLGEGQSEPAVIRSRLTPDVAAVFDAEWEFTLEAAKRTQDLTAIRDLLGKWRHFAEREQLDPGHYFRLLADAARIHAAGRASPGSPSSDEVRALLRERLRDTRDVD